MSVRVQRGQFKRSCQTCGWAGTYDTTSKADWAKRQHACQRRLDKAARSQAFAEKIARIDRTPKTCLHKVADHQHGTNACYVLDGCRCYPCSKARVNQDRQRNRAKAYGRYEKYVDADAVREHLAELAAYGIGLKSVARISGVSHGALTKIVRGVYAPSTGPFKGCKGTGTLLRGPARRVLRTTAERIQAVEAVPANLGPHQPDHERTAIARQHLRALVALGWSMSKLARRLGMQATNMGRVIQATTPMYRKTVDQVEALYAELSMTIPPGGHWRERISVSRSKRFAAARGWLPPLALDDDDPDYYASLSLDEMLEAGLTEAQVAGVLGCAAEDVENYLERRGWRGRRRKRSLDVAS